MARYAAIDVGTNSVKFHVGELRGDGTWSTIVDRAEITRLGEGLQESGAIQPAAMERTTAAIAGMVEEARRLGSNGIAAAGTMGLRTASNREDFARAVQQRCGVEVEVISGEEESRLAYLAVQSGLGLPAGTVVVFDTGGGSTQFTLGRGSVVEDRFSVDVGAVRYTETFGLSGVVSADGLRRAFEALASDLSRIDRGLSPDALVGMGGAVTNLAAVQHGLTHYDADVVQGSALSRAEVDRQIELYRSRSTEDRRRIVGLQPKRADVILAGAMIVRTILEKLHKDELRVSDRGLRHGLLAERFGRGPSSGPSSR